MSMEGTAWAGDESLVYGGVQAEEQIFRRGLEDQISSRQKNLDLSLHYIPEMLPFL